jgi:hypothetical protein
MGGTELPIRIIHRTASGVSTDGAEGLKIPERKSPPAEVVVLYPHAGVYDLNVNAGSRPRIIMLGIQLAAALINPVQRFDNTTLFWPILLSGNLQPRTFFYACHR